MLLAEAPNNRQRYFVRYLTSILIDLLVVTMLAAEELVARIYRSLE